MLFRHHSIQIISGFLSNDRICFFNFLLFCETKEIKSFFPMIQHYLFSFFLESLINQNRSIRFCVNSASLLLIVKNKRPGKISFIISIMPKVINIYKIYSPFLTLMRTRLFFLQRYIVLFNGFTHFPDSIIKNTRLNTFHNVQLSKVGI